MLLVKVMADAKTHVQSVAYILWSAGYWSSEEQAREELEKMIECGKKYKYLNLEIGNGVCLVLGTTLSESQYARALLQK